MLKKITSFFYIMVAINLEMCKNEFTCILIGVFEASKHSQSLYVGNAA